MISLDSILNSNLELLKEQETQLLKSLDFLQRAKQLFESQTEGTYRGNRRGGKPKVSNLVNLKIGKKVRKARTTNTNPGIKGKRSARPGYLNTITNILKEKNKPIGSGELIDAMFKSQSKNKNIKHFRTLVYPTLTKAYKSKVLQLKKGLIHLGKVEA